MITDFLKENKIPVVLTDIHSLPDKAHDHVVLPYRMPAMLKEAGVDFCITDNKGMTSRQRNLPFAAGTAVANGLAYEDAIKAITSDPARILGIGDRVGTIEKGKDATLFVSTGDALDMRTNNVEHAFIQGRQIQVNARQQFLYKKYSDKYGHEVYLTEEKKK
jgi:imidazolonepropionase-like amidohydrolase